MPDSEEIKALKALASDIEDFIASIPDDPVGGMSHHLLGRYRTLSEELRAKVVKLDPVSEPGSFFDPSNPALFGVFVAVALVGQDKRSLANIDQYRFYGSGVYAIYYMGEFPTYSALRSSEHPIYVGKAEPSKKDARSPRDQGEQLWKRLREHRRSISQAQNLNVADFECRFLAVQSGWETSAENALLNVFRPIWNNETKICYGVGKHGDSAGTRANKRSPWDVLHPGRRWADNPDLEDSIPVDDLVTRITDHLSDNRTYQHVDEILRQLLAN